MQMFHSKCTLSLKKPLAFYQAGVHRWIGEITANPIRFSQASGKHTEHLVFVIYVRQGGSTAARGAVNYLYK